MEPSRQARAERRASRRKQRRQSPFLTIPFRQCHNPFSPLEIASPEQIEQIHRASMHILENIGLRFLDNEALEMWATAGAKVDRQSQQVWLDRGLILELVAQAPSIFTWRARNPERNLTIGGNVINFFPGAGMVFATDLDRGRREGTIADYERFQKLTQMCNVLHFAGSDFVEPQDVAVTNRHLQKLLRSIIYSDKVAIALAHGPVIAGNILAMLRFVFGPDLADGGPVVGTVVNVNSPLIYDDRMVSGLIAFARAGQVNIITPFILAGAVSPITMAAALAQQNAEALAGVALTQLVRPGAPVIYGGFTTNIDMKSGSPAFGTPEGAWALSIGAQLARRYGLPYRGSGALNTSKSADAQAAYETMWTLWPAVQAHTNVIVHSAGWLESGLTNSFEKFIIDAENLAMMQHFLSGLEISEETLALDMIASVGPGGHHFGTGHTQARFQTEFYQPFLADRLNYETWSDAGAFDAAKRANLLWKELLAQYQPPPLDEGIKEALIEYVTRREQELAGVNLYG